jgi:glutamyl-Q tRNA(Asp) synthetase
MAFVTRFAPSPTGLLHRGHAYSAMTAFLAARAAGGRFLLRIEDLDLGRRRPEFEVAIFVDLAWIGLSWEEPVRRQSDHMREYSAALDALAARGLVYRCFKTRKELLAEIAGAPHGPAEAIRSGPLPAADERAMLDEGRAFAWRLSLDGCRDALGADWEALSFEADGVRRHAEPERLGDAVIGRKEFPASYHLASVHDDALQGVTHVIRGDDLVEAAHLHVLLQALFGWRTPVYRHHGLVCDAEGRRLAKRDHAETLQSLRETGADPRAMLAALGLPFG